MRSKATTGTRPTSKRIQSSTRTQYQLELLICPGTGYLSFGTHQGIPSQIYSVSFPMDEWTSSSLSQLTKPVSQGAIVAATRAFMDILLNPSFLPFNETIPQLRKFTKTRLDRAVEQFQQALGDELYGRSSTPASKRTSHAKPSRRSRSGSKKSVQAGK